MQMTDLHNQNQNIYRKEVLTQREWVFNESLRRYVVPFPSCRDALHLTYHAKVLERHAFCMYLRVSSRLGLNMIEAAKKARTTWFHCQVLEFFGTMKTATLGHIGSIGSNLKDYQRRN